MIDIEGGVARFIKNGKVKLEFKKQWVEFYALLATRLCSSKREPTFIYSPEVACVGVWHLKKPDNVGKVIARHISDINRLGFGNWLLDGGKTKSWKLALDRNELHFHPSKKEVIAWLNAKRVRGSTGLDKAVDVVPIQWVEKMIRSIIGLQSGRTKAAYQEAADGLATTEDSFLKGISIFWARRALQRHGPDEELEKQIEIIAHGIPRIQGLLGFPLDARLASIDALEERFDMTPQALQQLEKYCARMESTGDISGAAVLYNVLGVCARRLGDINRALGFLKRSMAFSILSGDLLTLQAALFNAGHSGYLLCRENLQKGLPPDEIVLRESQICLEFDRELRATHNLGRDSAQTELLLARIALYKDDVSSADLFLTEAEKILRNVQNEFEVGGYHRTRAKLLLKRCSLCHGSERMELRNKAIRHLEMAKRQFERAGDKLAIKTVTKELEVLKSGKDLKQR